MYPSALAACMQVCASMQDCGSLLALVRSFAYKTVSACLRGGRSLLTTGFTPASKGADPCIVSWCVGFTCHSGSHLGLEAPTWWMPRS